jgi:hypothetical protein
VEVASRQEADFVVPRTDWRKCTEEPTAAFFWTFMREHHWFLGVDYLGKHPMQQWRVRIGELAFDAYNFAEQRPVEREEVGVIANAIAHFDAHFPIPLQSAPKTIGFIDRFRPRVGSQRSYACMASAHIGARILSLGLNSGALSHEPYNTTLTPIATRSAVVLHESAHFDLDTKLSQDWRDAGFFWRAEHTESRGLNRIVNESRIYRPNQPRACVTEYAKSAEYEDIPESVVAYLGGSKDKLHPAKRRILRNHDHDLQPARPTIRAKGPEMPVLPEVMRFVVANIKSSPL